jgi:hypothetical protein
MPQDQTDRTAGQQAGEAVLEELRVLIGDVRTWLEAMPVATEPGLPRIVRLHGAVGSAPLVLGLSEYLGLPLSDVTPETAQLDVAIAVLDDHADALLATAERATEAVRERGDRIDAILAEIRRIRAGTRPA